MHAFDQVCAKHQVGADLVLAVPQEAAREGVVDTSERVEIGAAFVRDDVAQGL